MLKSFGKFCRKIRIDNNKLLYDMANQLGVSSAFLSKVENGKGKPPVEWRDILINEYNLNDGEIEELDRAMFEARNQRSIDMSTFKASDRDMMISFARAMESWDDEKKKKLSKWLKNQE